MRRRGMATIAAGTWLLLAIPLSALTFAQSSPKEALLSGLRSLDRGFAASDAQRADVLKQIEALLPLNPTRAPAERLGGEWTLIYTDAPDILNIPTTPFSSIGRIGQEIDADEGVIANVIEYRPSALAASLKEANEDAFVQRVFTKYAVRSPTTVDLQIAGLGLEPRRILGYEVPEALKLNLRGPLTLPFGRFEVLYLDDEIRIIRTGQGWYSVNRRGVFG